MAIKDVIDEIGLSFDELCAASEIPSSTLSDILSGKAVLSHCQARTIQKLSKGLDMSMEEVLALEESDFPACDCVPDTADDDDYDESEEEGPLHRLGCPAAFRLFRCSMLEMLHIHAAMSSYPGTIITVIATAYLTYRWYRARHQEVT